MKLLTKEQQNHMKMQKSVIFTNKYVRDKNTITLEVIVIIQGNIEVLRICNVKYIVTKKFLQLFIIDLTIVIILS